MIDQWISELRLRWKALVRRRQLDRDLEEELALHRAMREERLREAGVPPESAKYAARRRFGNATAIKETCRELWTFRRLEELCQDVRYGARVLLKSPGFTAVAILSLALGIGANTAIFSLIDAALLKSLPVQDPHDLVLLMWGSTKHNHISQTGASNTTDERGRNLSDVFTYPAFDAFCRESTQLSHVFGFQDLRGANVNIGGNARIANGLLASGDFHSGLGVQPLHGRLLTTEDDQPGAEPVVVISFQLWRDAFGASGSAVGAGMNINGLGVTVVGVTPPEFYGVSPGGFVSSPDVTVPLSLQPRVVPLWNHFLGDGLLAADRWWVKVMGRLAPSATAESVKAELDVVFSQVVAEAEASTEVELEGEEMAVFPGKRGLDYTRITYGRSAWTLMIVVGLVLMIACANIANLQLARATARQKEVTVRLAMGAGRWRLIRQLLTESLLISFLGGALGLVLAQWGSRALLLMITGSESGLRITPQIDLRVLAFTGALCLLTGVLFGLAPAFRASRASLASALKQGGGFHWTTRPSEHSSVLGRALIVFQVALCLLLVTGAGLFLRTLDNLRRVDVGFRTEGLLLFKLNPALNGYEGARLRGFYRNVQEKLEALPGAVSVSAMTNRLITGWSSNGPIYPEGATHLPKGRLPVWINHVGPRYFQTMGIPVRLGRDVQKTDNAEAHRVGWLSESAASEAFPDGSAVGRMFRFWGDEPGSEVEVVGVVAEAKYDKLKADVRPTVYAPFEHNEGMSSMNFVVRAAGRPEALISHARAAIRELDADVPMTDVTTQQRQIDDHLRIERAFAKLSTAFGLLAMLLACVGIYGVLAYAVARRTGEIGIRMALGAQRADIAWLVLRQTVLLLALGVAFGIAVALGATRLIASMLYGLEPHDPVTLAGAAVIISAVALLAGYLPGRRAARVNPTVALRWE